MLLAAPRGAPSPSCGRAQLFVRFLADLDRFALADADARAIREAQFVLAPHSLFIVFAHFEGVILWDLHVIAEPAFAAYEVFVAMLCALGLCACLIGVASSVADPRAMAA
jgi:hypothetical protein